MNRSHIISLGREAPVNIRLEDWAKLMPDSLDIWLNSTSIKSKLNIISLHQSGIFQIFLVVDPVSASQNVHYIINYILISLILLNVRDSLSKLASNLTRQYSRHVDCHQHRCATCVYQIFSSNNHVKQTQDSHTGIKRQHGQRQ